VLILGFKAKISQRKREREKSVQDRHRIKQLRRLEAKERKARKKELRRQELQNRKDGVTASVTEDPDLVGIAVGPQTLLPDQWEEIWDDQ
jgi:hypothetical protein